MYQVAGPAERRPEWFAGGRAVGLTAGTSTPDQAVEAVRAWLDNRAPAERLPAVGT